MTFVTQRIAPRYARARRSTSVNEYLRRRLAIIGLAAATIAATLIAAPPVDAAAPTCQGRTVTINLNSAGHPNPNRPAADVILGRPVRDVITAGGGADIICSGGGADEVRGGPGNDLIWGGGGNDKLIGGDGNDNLYGDDQNDNLIGGNGADRLFGNGGSDQLRGGNGRDWMSGAAGDDRMWGGADHDQLYGGDGNDILAGDTGHDVVDGGAGNDNLRGGGGNDAVIGASGNDRVNGDDGNDRLTGGSGFDHLYGHGGTDTYDGGSSRDRCEDTGQDLRSSRNCELDCSGRMVARTGLLWSDTTFECRYVTTHFEILYNAQNGIDRGKTTQEQAQKLGNDLEAAYRAYDGGDFQLRAPRSVDPVSGKIAVSLGGWSIPASGYSRQSAIMFKSGKTHDRFLTYHEVFHQFQWEYTNDDLSYVFNQSFFESMAQFAALRAIPKPGVTSLNRGAVCTGTCVTTALDFTATPWAPSYRGTYFFHWAERDQGNVRYLGNLLANFDRTENATTAVSTTLGEDAHLRYRTWILQSSPLKTQARNRLPNAVLGLQGQRYGIVDQDVVAFVVNHNGKSNVRVANSGSPVTLTLLPCGANQGRRVTQTRENNGQETTFSVPRLSSCTQSYLLVSMPLGFSDNGMTLQVRTN